jgi:hypothetical protein
MKRSILVIILLLFPFYPVFGQTNQPATQNVEQEITALENAWNDAAQKYDVSWFENNLTDSYIGTDEDGVVVDKAKVISDVKSRASKIEVLSIEKLKIQIYGDTVIATGVYIFKGTYKDKDISGKYPYTDTWIKLGGIWQCVAAHNSKLPSK